jgi:hypothetical protein
MVHAHKSSAERHTLPCQTAGSQSSQLTTTQHHCLANSSSVNHMHSFTQAGAEGAQHAHVLHQNAPRLLQSVNHHVSAGQAAQTPTSPLSPAATRLEAHRGCYHMRRSLCVHTGCSAQKHECQLSYIAQCCQWQLSALGCGHIVPLMQCRRVMPIVQAHNILRTNNAG